MKKVLIVDDSMFTRNIHRQIVQSGGYDTLEAAGGNQALEVYRKEKPDMVITDLLMPDMDGIDLVRLIRESDPKARIIVCSTDKQKFRQTEAKDSGAIAFVPKPADPEKLMEILNSCK